MSKKRKHNSHSNNDSGKRVNIEHSQSIIQPLLSFLGESNYELVCTLSTVCRAWYMAVCRDTTKQWDISKTTIILELHSTIRKRAISLHQRMQDRILEYMHRSMPVPECEGTCQRKGWFHAKACAAQTPGMISMLAPREKTSEKVYSTTIKRYSHHQNTEFRAKQSDCWKFYASNGLTYYGTTPTSSVELFTNDVRAEPPPHLGKNMHKTMLDIDMQRAVSFSKLLALNARVFQAHAFACSVCGSLYTRIHVVWNYTKRHVLFVCRDDNACWNRFIEKNSAP